MGCYSWCWCFLLGGLLSNKGANDRNDQQIGMSREQMAWQERMSNTAHTREIADLANAGLNPILSARAGASTPTGGSLPPLENALGAGVNAAATARLAMSQVENFQSSTELNEANAMKARAEAMTELMRPDLIGAQTHSATASVNQMEWITKKVGHEIDLVKEQIKEVQQKIFTSGSQEAVNKSLTALNEQLTKLQSVETQLRNYSLNEAKGSSEFHGAIGEGAPLVRMLLEILRSVKR